MTYAIIHFVVVLFAFIVLLFWEQKDARETKRLTTDKDICNLFIAALVWEFSLILLAYWKLQEHLVKFMNK